MLFVQQPAPTPTPQQQLAAQVQARLNSMDALSATVLRFMADSANEIYASRLGNGTADQTFAPADYFQAVQATGVMTPVQLCAISAATLTWMQTLIAITTPAGQTAPSLPQIPPAGITLAPAEDGQGTTVTGTTPLQKAQAAVISARAAFASAQAQYAADQTAATTAMQAAVAGGGTSTLEDAVTAARAQAATSLAALKAAQAELNSALAALRA